MKSYIKFILTLFLLVFLFSACVKNPKNEDYKVILPKNTSFNTSTDFSTPLSTPKTLKNEIDLSDSFTKTIINKYSNQKVEEWGENISNVKTKLKTDKKVIALTFDACGGKEGNGYDRDLINYLSKEKIKATLFINYRWIENNKNTFIELSKNALFEIENHGYKHKPLSISGESAYGIKGTSDLNEVIDEVRLNTIKIKELTNKYPKYFRPGTAFCDNVSLDITKEYGQDIVGYTLLGDAGATYSKDKIYSNVISVKKGSVLIFHMNKPRQETAEGIKMVIPQLKKMGFSFAKLEDFELE